MVLRTNALRQILMLEFQSENYARTLVQHIKPFYWW